MKSQKILLAAALLALGAASCQKEEKVITQFTACMEQSEAKTYLGNGGYFYWETTDEVKVYSDGDNGSDFTVTPRADNGTWAVLSGFTAAGSSYTAIYPADIAASATSVTLPAEQTSADGSLAEFPMYAESTTDEFQFKNLCGALRIHLEQANCTISRIELTAASPISGTYAVSTTTEGTPSLAYSANSANGANSVMLTLDTAQSIADGHDFYIYLPAGTYSNMQLTFYQPNGASCTKSGSNVTVERSKCTPVEITNDLAFGPASNEIWYTTSNGSPISNPSWTGYTVDSNTYQDGHYVITFASTVTSVPNSAFYSQSNLTSVTLPASVESIGVDAFNGCSNLTSATMPNVTSIGTSAFNGCSNLTSATMPNVTSIGGNAFKNCSKLTSATMPNVTSIGASAFNSCSDLTSATMPNVTNIGGNAFRNCSDLTSATMPNVESIGNYAFQYCSSLTSATMPNVESIGNYAFQCCSSLTSATMPNVTSIGISAFYDCSSLTSATMPNVESIERYAFYNCSSLTNLTLSASTNSVKSTTFADCSSLNVIYLPKSEAPSWLNDALGYNLKAENGTLHVRTGASTAASDWPGFDDGWDIVADL